MCVCVCVYLHDKENYSIYEIGILLVFYYC